VTRDEWKKVEQEKHERAYQRLKARLEKQAPVPDMPSLQDGSDGGPHRLKQKKEEK